MSLSQPRPRGPRHASALQCSKATLWGWARRGAHVGRGGMGPGVHVGQLAAAARGLQQAWTLALRRASCAAGPLLRSTGIRVWPAARV
eukprot:3342299-Prymnesium_polylepis.1